MSTEMWILLVSPFALSYLVQLLSRIHLAEVADAMLTNIVRDPSRLPGFAREDAVLLACHLHRHTSFFVAMALSIVTAATLTLTSSNSSPAIVVMIVFLGLLLGYFFRWQTSAVPQQKRAHRDTEMFWASVGGTTLLLIATIAARL